MKASVKDISDKKVLIIDDEVDMCMLMKSYFLRKNCIVYIAHTIADALRSIRRDVPEVILFDIGMSTDPDDTIKKLVDAAPNAQLIVSNSNNFDL